MMGDRLSGKSVVVTGAGSGIGLEIAERTAQEGAGVVLADVDLGSAERAATDLRDQGFHAQAVEVDISDENSVRRLISSALEILGTIDVFCNNAALTNQEFMKGDVDVAALDLEVWQRTLDVNLTGTMLCCKHVIPVMIGQGGGSIVNTSSGASLGGGSGLTSYGVSKAGVNLLTKSVATQYGRRGIRCNGIAPGPTITRSSPPGMEEFMKAQFEGRLITPYLGRALDIANAAVFLASDESRFITGQIISVDGGLFAYSPTARL
jgi:NAD(P)-dependent dehydrogenase (short-subunit alcohol dehydrogenase family)